MEKMRVSIRVEDIELVGELSLPGADRGVVLCHPHPLYGGDMNNNVIISVFNALKEADIASLRFNFRSVGGILGGEREDLDAAINFMMDRVKNIGLFGYSFGASVAISFLEDDRVKAISLSSPLPEYLEPVKAKKPLLIVCGGRDFIADPVKVEERAEKIGARVEVIKRADHFWWGFEDELARKVVDFFRENL